MATIIAKLVIKLVRNGERDLEQLRKQVFEVYQPSLHRAPRGASAVPGHSLANKIARMGWLADRPREDVTHSLPVTR